MAITVCSAAASKTFHRVPMIDRAPARKKTPVRPQHPFVSLLSITPEEQADRLTTGARRNLTLAIISQAATRCRSASKAAALGIVNWAKGLA
jgi:hypothetical protein